MLRDHSKDVQTEQGMGAKSTDEDRIDR